MSSIKIYENKTFKLNNVLKYEFHSADENNEKDIDLEIQKMNVYMILEPEQVQSV